VLQLQLFDELALVRDGRLLHVLSIPGSEGVYPSVLALAPRFTAGGKDADGPLLALTGAHLAGQDAAVLARCQGALQGCCAPPPAPAPAVGQQGSAGGLQALDGSLLSVVRLLATVCMQHFLQMASV
jgi:hypothetical protein